MAILPIAAGYHNQDNIKFHIQFFTQFFLYSSSLSFSNCCAPIMAFVSSLVPPFVSEYMLLDISICMRRLFFDRSKSENVGKTVQNSSLISKPLVFL